MAKAIEQIDQYLTALQEAIAQISAEFRSSYSSYLAVLAPAVRQQLILASYQMCTQRHPAAFLQLSVAERQNLQQGLQKLATQAQERLQEQAKLPFVLDAAPQLDLALSLEDLSAPPEASASQQELAPENADVTPQDPEVLAQWQENVEKAIAKILRNLSRDANRLLQQAGILPQKLPPQVLEAALKAENAGELISGSPNLLSITIEGSLPEVPISEEDIPPTKGERENRNSTIMQVSAINLRLAEIEFANPALMGERNQIRQLLSRLSALRRDYQKQQKERTIAEAELAWRAIWFEE